MIPKPLSQRIDITRFVMLLAVIAIHSNYLQFVNTDDAPIAVFITKLFSEWLPTVAVPYFFFISAYLSETKHSDADTVKSFADIVKRRFSTILLPYIIWNILAFAIRVIVNLTPLNRYTSGGPVFDTFLGTIEKIFWTPELVPLWFLRNLMFFIVLFPLLQKLLKFSPLLLLVISGAIDYYFTFPALSGIVYFTFGMAVARWFQPGKFEDILIHLQILAIFYILAEAALMIFVGDINMWPILQMVLRIVGLLGFMSLCSRPISSLRRIESPGAIFFVYAFHGIISPYVIKGLLLLFNWEGESLLLCYFLIFASVTTLSFSAYLVSNRYFPCLTNLLSGRRSDL